MSSNKTIEFKKVNIYTKENGNRKMKWLNGATSVGNEKGRIVIRILLLYILKQRLN